MRLITKTLYEMAHIYTVKCPKCGKEFEVMKGILMSEVDKEVPADRDFNVPAVCPTCKFKIDLQDPANEKYISLLMLAD